jgi:hypothetical protein
MFLTQKRIHDTGEVKMKKVLDNNTTNSLQSFFKDEKYEIISKTDITNMTGDFK